MGRKPKYTLMSGVAYEKRHPKRYLGVPFREGRPFAFNMGGTEHATCKGMSKKKPVQPKR